MAYLDPVPGSGSGGLAPSDEEEALGRREGGNALSRRPPTGRVRANLGERDGEATTSAAIQAV